MCVTTSWGFELVDVGATSCAHVTGNLSESRFAHRTAHINQGCPLASWWDTVNFDSYCDVISSHATSVLLLAVHVCRNGGSTLGTIGGMRGGWSRH